MCGIAGFISPQLKEAQLHLITRALQHRGPDAEGFYFEETLKANIGLGHRRLSILDLSAAGNQPFFSKDGRYVMVYNGEMYNFREVAEKYKISMQTSSDTEVIIEAFAKHGISCVQDFNGMFAMAIWDRQDAKMYLIRDRVGIKPLYYYQREGTFAFASELKSLFKLPVEKEINSSAVFNFLHLGYIPGSETIYNSCKKLKPGHYAIVTANEVIVKSYWQIEDKLKPKTFGDEKVAKEELDNLLQTSVAYCMISDVPLGVFLSGGIDSSLVAAIAQKQSALPVKTFSIAFEDKKYNEAPYAKQVADQIGSQHHEFTVTEKEAICLADSLLDVYDEPYADSSAIPTMMVSKFARKEVTVALSGDGGDELFMGYGFYYWARRLQNPLLSFFRKPVGAALRLSGNKRFERASTLFNYPSVEKRKSHIFSQEQYYFTENEINGLLKDKGEVNFDQSIHYAGRKFSWAEEQSFFDIKNYLPEELLVKTDRASMQYSLEVRVPLLDHRLVEFALNLSPELKLREQTGKYLLKQVLYNYLPESLFNRPKWGFAVPLGKWLKGDLRYLIDKYLDRQVVEECGLVNTEKVESLKKAFFGGKDYLYTRVWALVILHKWYKEKHC
jgi:asparagine synthase (glutamine-hydrolysing)